MSLGRRRRDKVPETDEATVAVLERLAYRAHKRAQRHHLAVLTTNAQRLMLTV